jgi:hypothetical protein
MEMRRVVVLTALVGLVTLLVTVPPAAGAPGQERAAAQEARVDFNDDGFTDLGVGAPGEDVGAATDAGALNVMYGSAGGLQASADVFFQGSRGVGGSLEDNDRFGAAVAKGDFNDDGIFDLAVGAPGEAVGSDTAAGAVNVLNGSSGGLTGGPLFTQANAETGDGFGAALAAGDFDDDGVFDLAIGAPGETVGGRAFAGAVSVFNGPPSGLANERLLFQGTAGIPGSPESFDQFGGAVAPTDSNGIGQWDLAVGVPGEDLGPDENAGVVNLLAGSAGGPGGGTLVTQANPEDFDNFGSAIAGGFFLHDFDLNGFFDLAVGAPGETVGAAAAAGAVSVFNAFGGGGGTVVPGPVFTQGSGGLGGTAETGDTLGVALE